MLVYSFTDVRGSVGAKEETESFIINACFHIHVLCRATDIYRNSNF